MKSQVMGRRTQDPWSRARSRRTPQRVSPAEPARRLLLRRVRIWRRIWAGIGAAGLRAEESTELGVRGRGALRSLLGATEPGAPRPRPGSRRPVCGEQGRPVRGRSPSPKGALSPAEPREQPRPRPAHARWLPGSEAFLLAKGPDPGLRVAPSGTGKAHRKARGSLPLGHGSHRPPCFPAFAELGRRLNTRGPGRQSELRQDAADRARGLCGGAVGGATSVRTWLSTLLKGLKDFISLNSYHR